MHARCKICQSKCKGEIDKMLVEGKPYNEIISTFPELNLNKANLSNHKKHIMPEVAKEARKKYQQLIDELADIVVDEAKALDIVIAQAFEIFHQLDETANPKVVEAWGNLLLRAIKLKRELFRDKIGGELSEILGMI